MITFIAESVCTMFAYNTQTCLCLHHHWNHRFQSIGLAWIEFRFFCVCFDCFELNASHCAKVEIKTVDSLKIVTRYHLTRSLSFSLYFSVYIFLHRSLFSMCCFSIHCSSIALCAFLLNLFYFLIVAKWKRNRVKKRVRARARRVKRHMMLWYYLPLLWVYSVLSLFFFHMLWEINRWKHAAGDDITASTDTKPRCIDAYTAKCKHLERWITSEGNSEKHVKLRKPIGKIQLKIQFAYTHSKTWCLFVHFSLVCISHCLLISMDCFVFWLTHHGRNSNSFRSSFGITQTTRNDN